MSTGFELDGWAVLIHSGMTFIGLPDWAAYEKTPGACLHVDPIYSLGVQLMQGPGGQQGIMHVGSPVLYLGSMTKMDLPDGGICIHVADLSKDDQKKLGACVNQAEEALRQIRGAQSGIQIAKTMPRIVQ